MKAIVKTKKAHGAELIDLDIPEPKLDEVLIKPKAVSICGTDVHIYNWDSWAQARVKGIPQVLGHEFSGEIVATGSEVKKFKVGDFVSAETHIFCGKCVQCQNDQKNLCSDLKILGVDCDGCFAEYIALPEKILWKNDLGISPEIASLQEPLGNANYCALADGENLNGKTVLIFGDGPTGLFAAGVAKAEGALTVILVGENKKCLKIAKKMGADFTIRYAPERDIVKLVLDYTKGYNPDIVLEMAGAPAAIELAFKLVRKGGRISAFGIPTEKITLNYTDSIIFKGVKIFGISGRKIWQTWEKVSDLLKSGRIDISPVITHKLPMKDFEKGFNLMTARPKVSAKVILYPQKGEE